MLVRSSRRVCRIFSAVLEVRDLMGPDQRDHARPEPARRLQRSGPLAIELAVPALARCRVQTRSSGRTDFWTSYPAWPARWL